MIHSKIKKERTMEQIYQLEITVQTDGRLILENLPFKAGDTVEVKISSPQQVQSRPFGLCAG